MSYIYKVTNKVNGKMYIGQHKYDGASLDPYYKGSGVLLWRAYKKYGIDNFDMELVEECPEEDLNPLEELYIEHYNTLFPNGYNLTKGGDGVSGYKFSEDSKQKMSNSHKGVNPWNKGIKMPYYVIEKLSIQINQYDDNGDLIKTYPSTQEAARQLNGNPSAICQALKGICQKAYGFRFRYANECGDKIEPYTKPKLYNQKQINQYTLDEKYIKTWDSLADIERELGYDKNGVWCCCKGKYKQAYGFKWEYKEKAA